MKWTSEQQKVIDYRNRNILVSAAAGSGKTAVLVERIIKRITEKEHPVDIDKLLVVTFTKAAAAEMRERIGNAIEKLLEEYPEDENLRKQQTLLHNAQITTIDSFCLFVVRNHFEEIDLEPNFRIADQGEIKLLEMDVLNEVFEKEYERAKTEESSAFLQLVDAYSDKRSSKAVKEMVLKIYHQSASNPWPEEWIQSLSKPYLVESKEELLNNDFMKGIFCYVKAIMQDMQEKARELQSIALQPDGPQKYAQTLDRDIAMFQELEDMDTIVEMEQFFSRMKFSSLAAIRKFEGDVLKKEAVSEGRKEIKEDCEDLKKRYFSLSLEELAEQLKRMRPMAEELIRLSLLYLKAMEEKKKEKHIMDFSDIEHAALRILVYRDIEGDNYQNQIRPTAKEFRKQFEEIMIDEYQDSNQVQEEILCAISRESLGMYNMFMVGDVKQSIYRFRLARPELFMEKFATYDLEESKKQRIDLHKNFRSRREVLDFTNDIFYKIMDGDLGKVTYDKEAALYCGADYPEDTDMKAEVLLYETDAEEAEETDSLTNRQLEARMIAERIWELKNTLQITDKATGELRPVKNSDIVILLRSLQGWGNDFVAVLEDCGIPAHVSVSTGYFSAIEVQTVLSFLKILDNPYQDIPMAAVLKSAIAGLDDEELAEISLTKDTSSFAAAALRQIEAAEEGKLYRFKLLYQKLRGKVMDTPIHQLIDMVLEDTGYGDYVKALPAGKQRSANLDMLIEKAIAYEKTSYKGLFHFVRYIDQLQKYEVDFGEADVTGENEDVVRIMTIHKSKGLEFPVVFVSGISKKFNGSDSRDKMAIHPDMGLGLDEIQVSPRVKRKCLIRSEIAEQIRRDNLGEELRVLYVALTRAKEKLILTGIVKSQETLYKRHKGMVTEGKSLSFSQRTKATSYLDWVAPAVLSYPFKYNFTFQNAAGLVLAEVKKQAQMDISKEVLLAQIERADDILVENYRARFAYKYPYEQELGRKSKYSVSEIKHDSMVENYDRMEGQVEIPEFLLEERESYVPEFARELFAEQTVVKMQLGKHLEECTEDIEHIDREADMQDDEFVKGANAAEKFVDTEEASIQRAVISAPYGISKGALRGTAVHRVMECMDFAAFLQVDATSKNAIKSFVRSELERMKENHLLSSEQLELIRPWSLFVFFQSPTALRMAKADAAGDLFREKPFVMDYEGVLVQGIIDVFWLEEDRIVLLDYKTDRVNAAEELVARYKTQLDLYGQALSRVFSVGEKCMKKTENLIYSFCLDKTIIV